MSRNPFRTRIRFRFIALVGLALALFLQFALFVPAHQAQAATVPTASTSQSVSAEVSAAGDTGDAYLNKLFGNFGSTNANSATAQSSGPVEWFLIIFGTLVYGQIALLVVLWILFTSDLVGIIVGLILIGIILSFVLPRKPRAIALFVLACLNFVLGASITVVVAYTEGVPTVLVSLVPLGALIWLALRQVQFHFAPAQES